MVTEEKSFGSVMNEVYSESEESLVGIYLICKPTILVRNPKIVEMILHTHLESFNGRGGYPVLRDCFRKTLLSALAEVKVRQAFKKICSITKGLQEQLKRILKDQPQADVQIKDLCYRFSVDIISATIFGTEISCLSDKDPPLTKVAKKFYREGNYKILESLRIVLVIVFPFISPLLGVGLLPSYMTQIIMGFINKFIISGENEHLDETKNKIKTLLTNQRDKPFFCDYKIFKNWSISEDNSVYSFFLHITGSESSTSTICYCLFELSREPKVLQILIDEIDEALHECNGKITYDIFDKMPFLEKCLAETLRKYPAFPLLNRRCTKDFQVPGTKQIIYQDQAIIIPLRAIQTDPKYFPNPLKFNPNRTEPNDPDYSGMPTYIFGDGPKTCIAYRLGKIILKMGLIAILSKFTVERGPTEELNIPIGNLGMPPSDDFTVKLSMRHG